ncbi:MAG: endo-1,4-beta-xylanase, partial [Henriciella sp.]|uniref:endo-1,4-beta-xylanase n=1 Tax=Henriciella sp. TaxID=1968823 RepID=UPI003C731D81
MTKLSRREWLKMGAGASAWAGLGGCVTAGESTSVDAATGPGLHVLAAEKGIRFGSAMGAGQLDDPQYLDIIRRECATIVAENEHKWYTIYPEPDVVNFDPADRLVSFAKDNGLTMRGHTLLWHREKWSPEWVNNLEFASAAETEKFVGPRIAQVASRYHPFIYSWDVVNEAISDETGEFRQTSLSKKMGEELIDFCFAVAKENAPDAKLVYNDFMSWEKTSTAHRKGVLQFLERLLSRGVPVDGLGMQSHSNYEMPGEFTAEKQRDWIAFCDEVVDMGLELYITEFDVNDTRMRPDIAYRDRLISEYTRRYFDLMLQYPQLK